MSKMKNIGISVDIRNRILGGLRYSASERQENFNKFVGKFLNSDSENLKNFENHVISLYKTQDKTIQKPNHSRTNKKLNYRKRKELGLYTVGRRSLKYKDLIPLHKLWTEYMIKYLDIEELREKGWTNSPENPNFEQVSLKLYRADYHGSNMKVLRSSCPSYVGICGVVAMETKNCFKLLGTDNIVRNIPKASCVFTFKIQEFEFMFYGKNLQAKPAERSSRKLKTVYVSDLLL